MRRIDTPIEAVRAAKLADLLSEVSEAAEDDLRGHTPRCQYNRARRLGLTGEMVTIKRIFADTCLSGPNELTALWKA